MTDQFVHLVILPHFEGIARTGLTSQKGLDPRCTLKERDITEGEIFYGRCHIRSELHANAVAIEVGQSVYPDTTDKDRLRLADTSSAAKAAAYGIAISKANAANQRVGVVWSSDVENCTSGTQGEFLYVSSGGSGRGDFSTSMGFRKAPRFSR